MTRLIAAMAMAGTFSYAVAAQGESPARWQFAGENQGIRFYFKIANECRDSGAKVDLKLENTLDHSVTVHFRVVDPEWKQSFERELGSEMKDMAIKFTPEDGSACHPYIDEVYVESKETQVTHSDASLPDENLKAPGTPADQ
jgi:hypothetical protein